MQSIAQINTVNASRYLQQLCKHWGHRFPVAFDESQGSVAFDGTTCLFQAAAEQLIITLETTGEDTLERMEEVVASHLERFAFRDDLVVHWSRSAA